MSARHNVLNVTVEMAPLIKLGGLGDVLASLPKTLNKSGAVDARVLLPAFPGAVERARSAGHPVRDLGKDVHAAIDWRVWSASILEADVDGVKVYLLEQPELFGDPKVYPSSLTKDSLLPFVFLSYAALELPKVIGWTPDIYHVHDWSAAILPIALKWHKHYREMAEGFDIVLMIHNLAHQGLFDPSLIESWGLDRDAFSINGLEFYGQANLLKGAALSSDAVVAVSPHYSWDIQTYDGGFGLHGVFSDIRNRLSGILNGIDYDIWSPAKDKLLPARFSAKDLSGKRTCREHFFKMCGWPDDGRPALLFVGRLVQQKGVDIMLRMLEDRLSSGLRAAVIGSGVGEYESWCEYLRRIHPETFWCFSGFDEKTAHLAYAGADMLMMPSLFEPCGLSQMIAMSYGTIPIVRNTGGLADSVIDFDGSPDGTGFIFSDYSSEELSHAVDRAIGAFYDKPRWDVVMKNAMKADLSWTSSTKAYIALYDKLKNGD